MKPSLTLALSLLLATSLPLHAQDSTRISPLHISIVTPLGTNGMQSWNTTNIISVNLFAGYSGGLKGIEFGGFANALKGDMNGIQVAGFCNNTLGRANGLEIAGFWNFNKGKINGLQLSGFANAALDTVNGFQGAGFVNYANGSTNGQASGFANICTRDLSGIQASGFFNYARKLRGVQISVFNVADTVERGIPIGFLSFVRNGYKVIQIGGNETLFGEISFKTGVRKFYNILSVGATVKDEQVKWGFGYGIGTLVPLGKRLDMSLEAECYEINEDVWFTDDLDILNRLNVALSYNLTRSLGVYAGASWNVHIIEDDWHEGDHYDCNSEVSMYPGFTAGVRVGF